MKKHTATFLSILVVVGVIAWPQEGKQIDWFDPALNDIVSLDARIETLADGFKNLEGPVWVRKGGYLLFSDISSNVINKWNSADRKVSVFLDHSGFTGADSTTTSQGSNGITLDRQGRVVFCATGDGQIVRLEKNGKRTVLASEYNGHRLNGPNDLVYKSDGSLYFTDGSPRDPKTGIPRATYLLKGGKLQLLTKDLTANNGLALAPGEKALYIINDPLPKMIIMHYDVLPDDTIANEKLFIDMGLDRQTGHPDGMKVDKMGNVYSVGPGGVWIVSPEGKHLGTILAGDLTNLAFGDADGKTLYMTGRRPRAELFRIRLKIPGIRPD
jgi:gluconolactonase